MTEKKSREVLIREFDYEDIVKVMSTPHGRRTIAGILELLGYEQDAMASNATHIAGNVARQAVAHELKDWIWVGGGKELWRRMEDEIELRDEETEKEDEQLENNDYDLADSLDD